MTYISGVKVRGATEHKVFVNISSEVSVSCTCNTTVFFRFTKPDGKTINLLEVISPFNPFTLTLLCCLAENSGSLP